MYRIYIDDIYRCSYAVSLFMHLYKLRSELRELVLVLNKQQDKNLFLYYVYDAENFCEIKKIYAYTIHMCRSGVNI